MTQSAGRGKMSRFSRLRSLFSLVFGKVDAPSKPTPPPKWVLCVSVNDRHKLDIFQENLRSHAIEFQVRNGTDLFVPENELETAKTILAEGQWEY